MRTYPPVSLLSDGTYAVNGCNVAIGLAAFLAVPDSATNAEVVGAEVQPGATPPSPEGGPGVDPSSAPQPPTPSNNPPVVEGDRLPLDNGNTNQESITFEDAYPVSPDITENLSPASDGRPREVTGIILEHEKTTSARHKYNVPKK